MTNQSAEAQEREAINAVLAASPVPSPIDMVLHCPACHVQHIDAPDERTPDWKNEPHKSHLCHGCGHIWRPADVPTNGVASIKTEGKNNSPVTMASSAREPVGTVWYRNNFPEDSEMDPLGPSVPDGEYKLYLAPPAASLREQEAEKAAREAVEEFKRRWMRVPPFADRVNKATREAVSFAISPIVNLPAVLDAQRLGRGKKDGAE